MLVNQTRQTLPWPNTINVISRLIDPCREPQTTPMESDTKIPKWCRHLEFNSKKVSLKRIGRRGNSPI
jgi:hypothetical protein